MPLPSIQILMEFYSENCNYFIVKGFGFGFGFGFSETFGFWFRFRRNRKRGFVGSLIEPFTPVWKSRISKILFKSIKLVISYLFLLLEKLNSILKAMLLRLLKMVISLVLGLLRTFSLKDFGYR